MSGSEDPAGLRPTLQACGATTFLLKPLQPAQVLDTLAQCLKDVGA